LFVRFQARTFGSRLVSARGCLGALEGETRVRGITVRFKYLSRAQITAGGEAGTGQWWSPRRIRPRGQLLLAGCFALAMFVAVPLPFSSAVIGWPAAYNPGQVRIYENGECVGAGTLVDANWVLTTGHNFRAVVREYTFRFGGVDSSDDSDTQANLRVFDRAVVHPTVPDLVMVHFADPVPRETFIPRLAATNPFRTNGFSGVLWGWGDPRPGLGGTKLRYGRTRVIDLDPVANREAMKQDFPDLVAPLGDSSPFALSSHVSTPGDSGSGFFRSGLLAALHWGSAGYRRVNASGQLFGPFFEVSWEIPLWPYASWIQSVINGEGSSTDPGHDELKRRRLQEREADNDGSSVMTGPPEVANDGCDTSDMSCYREPVEPSAVLIGFSTNQGTVLVRCAGNDKGEACSFDQKIYPRSTQQALPLAPPPQPGTDAQTGRRDVVIWCKYRGSLTTDSPPHDLVRFSFTNIDAAGVTPAYGWWDVSLAQIEEAPDDPIDAVDLDELAVCAL
jgi:hypothetical protein